MNASGGQFEHLPLTVLYKLSSFVSVSDILLLQLSELHINRVNDCLYCISCMVCYMVDKLRSRYDSKLQHAFFKHFLLVYFGKNVKIGLESENSFVEIKPVSVVKHVEIGTFISPR